ncbi:MAG: SRPBCC domain-containing protein [Chloroflexaceae bacterium]|jgi:uncharacterized protein YndB with AHSA1/START domain|nr:SRPBCC domain-containing protein [Chloroflexaceae bacterium]
MATRVDTAARLLRAPAATIYQAFATADAMTAWLPPQDMSGTMLAFDFREGGAYRLRLTYNEPDYMQGKTTADSDEVAVRFVRLVLDTHIEQAVTFTSDDPAFAGEMRMIWTFDAVPGGTLVTVRCEDVPVGIAVEDHRAGLASTLSNLATFVEQGT